MLSERDLTLTDDDRLLHGRILAALAGAPLSEARLTAALATQGRSVPRADVRAALERMARAGFVRQSGETFELVNLTMDPEIVVL